MFCDMTDDGGGWTQVFKVNDGLAGDASALWSGGPLNEGMPDILGRQKAAQNYTSSIISQFWNVAPFGIRDVLVHVYIAGQLRAFVKFDGILTTPTSWFDAAHVKAATWTDLTSSTVTNFFSIAGDPTNVRRFFINSTYGGCTVDMGWLVVSSGTACAWEDATTNMAIFYSNLAMAGLWQNSSASRADVFTVYVR
jgi:hypothetical protein